MVALLLAAVAGLAVAAAGFCCLLGRAVWVDLLSIVPAWFFSLEIGGAPLDKFFMGEGSGGGDVFLVPSGLPKNCRGSDSRRKPSPDNKN